MAKVVLVGLETSTANQIRRALQGERHEIELRQNGGNIDDIIHADIVFADYAGKSCLSLLKKLRVQRPSLPFVVVTRTAETAGWLDALEAGATDYCTAPIEARQINWIMESALKRPAAALAA